MRNVWKNSARSLPLAAIAATITLLVTGRAALAQDDPTAQQPVKPEKASSSAFDLKGEYGAFGELYTISGHEKRRPASTGRIFLRSTVTAWNSISASFNLMLSNEGSSSRQDINQLDFNPRWKWGSAHAGDFCEELTPLTLSGIHVRGGALILTPGGWRVSLISGMTNRSVAADGGSRSYERSITGIKLGYGKRDGSSFELNALGARDKLNSIADAHTDTSRVDSTVMDFKQNPVSVTPQENLVLSAATNLALMNRKLRWRNEFGASGITRDRRSAELDNSDVPGILTSIFTPRKTSGADYAYTSDLNLDLRKISFNAGLHYIGPGYVSLGLASLISDKQEVTAGSVLRFTGGMVRFDAAVQHDNLIHQKNYTTNRNRVNSTVSYRLRPNWNATFGATYVGMANDSKSDTTRLDYSSWIFRTGQNLTYRRQIGLKALALDYTFQTASDKNPLRRSSGTNSTSVTASAPCGVTPSLDLVPTVSFASSAYGGNPRTLTQSYSLSARHVALQQRLASSATLMISVAELTTTIRPSARSNYDLTNNFAVTVELESTLLRGGPKESQFSEFAGRLILTRRF
jgi:hypothetical protein